MTKISTPRKLPAIRYLYHIVHCYLNSHVLSIFLLQVLTQELVDKDDSLHKQGSSDTVQPDPEGHSNDASQYALEESELFPVSRASSCTVVSEQEKRVLSPATSIDRETPVVKPHPFSFRTTPLSTTGTGSSTDSFHRHHTSSESECYERQSDTASSRAIRSKSTSFNYSGEYSSSTLVPSGSLKNSPLVSAKQQQYENMRSHVTTDSSVSSTTNTLCTCNSRDHPVASKDDNAFGYRQFRCKCHYGDPRSCAFDPETESMGFCPINQGFVKFDPNRRYSDEKLNLGLIVTNTPPSRDSSNISLSSNFSQSPHTTQLPGMMACSPPYHSNKALPSRGPYSESPRDTYSSNAAIRTSCTSIDSGYEKSMSMSSFTSSAREPSSLGSAPCQPQYGSSGDVSMPTSSSSTEPHGGDDILTKPRARSLCDMEHKEDTTSSSTTNLLNQGVNSLYPKLPTVTPQVVIDDCNTLTSQQALEAKLTTSVTSTCSSDTATPVGPLSKSATPSPSSSIGNPTNSSSLSKTELRRAFFANKGKKAKGIRTIEDSQLKQQLSTSAITRPRSQAISYTQDNKWKTKSCEPEMTATCTNDNHLTSTPTYFGNRTLGTTSQCPPHSSAQCNPFSNGCTSSHCPVDFECPSDLQTAPCAPLPQTHYSFGVYPFAARFEARPLPNNGSPYQPTFGCPNALSFSSTTNSKSGTQASASMAVAAPPTLILPSDAQSVISETDSGHCTKSIDDRSQVDGDACSQASELSNLDNTSEYSEVDNDVFGVRQRGVYTQASHRNQQNHQNQYNGDESVNPEGSLSASYLKLLRNSPSLLQQKLREYEDAMYGGGRPRMLEQFDDFTDVDLPTFDEFCLDDTPSEMETGGADGTPSHRHRMGDFGHSLFAGYVRHS